MDKAIEKLNARIILILNVLAPKSKVNIRRNRNLRKRYGRGTGFMNTPRRPSTKKIGMTSEDVEICSRVNLKKLEMWVDISNS